MNYHRENAKRLLSFYLETIYRITGNELDSEGIKRIESIIDEIILAAVDVIQEGDATNMYQEYKHRYFNNSSY